MARSRRNSRWKTRAPAGPTAGRASTGGLTPAHSHRGGGGRARASLRRAGIRSTAQEQRGPRPGAEASGAAGPNVHIPASHALPHLRLRYGPRRASSQTRPRKAAAGRTHAAGRGRRRERPARGAPGPAQAPWRVPPIRTSAHARGRLLFFFFFLPPPLFLLSPAPLLHCLG